MDPKQSMMSAATKKRLQRGKDILEMIEMEVIAIDLLNMPPLTEYQLFIRNFGNANTQQAYTQSNEDIRAAETQTDEVEYESKYTQFPADSSTSGVSRDNEEEESTESVLQILAKQTQETTNSLVRFMETTAQVCEVLLEENMADYAQRKATFTSKYSFCSQYVNIECPVFLMGRPVRGI